jgi:hypothetical protein
MTIFYVFYFFRAKFLFFHSWNSPYFWDQWGAPPLTPITRWNLATRPRFIDELETSFILSPDGNRRAEFVTLPGVRPKRCCSLGDNVRLKGNIKKTLTWTNPFFGCIVFIFYTKATFTGWTKMSFTAWRACRSKLDNWGGAHIHIFVFCVINFFWNRLFLWSVNMNRWIWAPPPHQLSSLLRHWRGRHDSREALPFLSSYTWAAFCCFC